MAVALAFDTANRQIGRRLQPQALNDTHRQIVNVPCHLKSSSVSPNKYGAETDMHASPTVARKPEIDRDEVRTGLHLALVTKVPQYRNPAKEVAHATGASEGTVRSLRQCNIPEAMVTLIMLARAYPQFGGEVRRLMGAGDLDPDFQRDLADLLRRAL